MSYYVRIDIKVPWKNNDENSLKIVEQYLHRNFDATDIQIGRDYVIFDYLAHGDYDDCFKEIMEELVKSELVNMDQWKEYLKDNDFYFNFYEIEDPEESFDSEDALNFLKQFEEENNKKRKEGE